MVRKTGWEDLKRQLQICRECHTAGLLEPRAFPLFGQFTEEWSPVLFIMEAPNGPDTFDADKGFLTFGLETDPSGRLFDQLFREELGLPERLRRVTNSVLCLPKRKGDRHPVSPKQRESCLGHLRSQILVLDPLVVVTVGGRALDATRRLESHRLYRLRDAVGKEISWLGRWLFPVFHTGQLARNSATGRPAEQQRVDWQRLGALLARLG